MHLLESVDPRPARRASRPEGRSYGSERKEPFMGGNKVGDDHSGAQDGAV